MRRSHASTERPAERTSSPRTARPVPVRARRHARVVLRRGAQPAHRVRGDRQHGLAREVVALGEGGHDHRRPDVPDRAGEQDRVVAVDRVDRVGDGRACVGVLFAHVAVDRLVVVVGVGIGGLDAVYVAGKALGDHPGQHLGVADAEVASAAVPVVLARTREVREQDTPIAGSRPPASGGLRLPTVRGGASAAGAQRHPDRRGGDTRRGESEEDTSPDRARHLHGGRRSRGRGA